MAPYRKTDRVNARRRATLDEPVNVTSFHKNRRGDVVRVTLSTFEGSNLCDIRQFFTSRDSGLPCPTKKGIAISVLRLDDMIEALQQAQKRAIELGLLDAEDR